MGADAQVRQKSASAGDHGRPTHVRWNILLLMLVLSTVTYLDRVNISIAARHITSTYGLSDVDMGTVFSAFILAYGLFQLPGGWLADRYGPRIVLMGALVWWSGFTALTAFVADLIPQSWIPAVWSLVIARFCLGMGEAAAWPNFNRTNANWMPVRERAFATSVPLTGGGLGAAVTPPFIAWLMLTYGWRESFYVCALIGLVVAAIWYWYVRDKPEEHPHINILELQLIHDDGEAVPMPAATAAHPAMAHRGVRTPWKTIFTEPNVWLLFSSAMSCGYLVYIFMSWFYVYLVEERGLSQMQGSLYTTGPFIGITVMTPIGGILCDKASRRFGKTVGRRVISMSGMFTAGLLLLVGAQIPSINVAIIALSLGGGAIYFALSSHWATTIDISKEYAGTVSGVMNWGGNMGGMVSPILTPILAKRFGWTPALQVAGIIIIVGGFLWFFVRPEKEMRTHSHNDSDVGP